MSQLNYGTFVTQIANMMPTVSSGTEFMTMVPNAIDYAEGRMYRELDLLATRVTDATTSVSSGVRNFTLPTGTGTFLVVEQINLISNNVRNPVTFTSREFIDSVYPSQATATGTPLFAAMASDTQVIFGPAPDAVYTAEVVGTQRPVALSSANSSTILTQMLPGVFFAAAMIFVSGYMRNFGAQADDPQMGASWESQYQKLMQSANIEELRKRFMSQAWTDKTPDPLVQRA